MKLPFFKRSNITPSKFFTVVIDSGSVKTLSFYKDDGIIKIIGYGKENIENGVVRNGLIVDFEQASYALEKSLLSANENAEESISNAVFGLSGDLCQEQFTTAKINHPSGDPLSEKEVDSFQKKIIETAYIQVQEDYAQSTGNTDTDFEIITSSVVQMRADGKSIENLIGIPLQTAEMSLYTAFCPTHHIKSVQKLTKKHRLNLLALSSEPFAISKALNSTEMESNDYLTMQIGSDYTEVSVVFYKTVMKSRCLHIGKKHFIQEISNIMGLTMNEAGNVFSSYSRGELSQSEGIIIQNCLADILDIWLDGIKILFSDFSGIKTFPSDLYLFGEGSQITEIDDVLNKNPWTRSIPFKAPPRISTLAASDFTKVADSTGVIKTEEWSSNVFLSSIYEELV